MAENKALFVYLPIDFSLECTILSIIRDKANAPATQEADMENKELLHRVEDLIFSTMMNTITEYEKKELEEALKHFTSNEIFRASIHAAEYLI